MQTQLPAFSPLPLRLCAASSTASKLSLTATDQLGQWLKHPSTNVSHIANPNQSHLSHVDFTVLPWAACLSFRWLSILLLAKLKCTQSVIQYGGTPVSRMRCLATQLGGRAACLISLAFNDGHLMSIFDWVSKASWTSDSTIFGWMTSSGQSDTLCGARMCTSCWTGQPGYACRMI